MSRLVTVVAGATRGAGRGIARGLGEVGAVVYCTGRSAEGHRSPYNRPETIEETAAMVDSAGGEGVPIRVDHTVETEVQNLFKRVQGDQGRLDVLVCSVAGEDPLLSGGKPFWETDLTNADHVIRQTVLSHLITAKHAARVMVKARKGLIVEITEGDIPGMASGNILSDLQKASHKSLAWRMANELREFGVAAVVVTPGFLRSESVLDHFGVSEATWKDGGKKDEHFLASESPLFIGRSIAALVRDPEVITRSGDLTSSWELAREYDVTDSDGTRPDWGAHMTANVVPKLPWYREALERQVNWLERMAERGRRYLGRGPGE